VHWQLHLQQQQQQCFNRVLKAASAEAGMQLTCWLMYGGARAAEWHPSFQLRHFALYATHRKGWHLRHPQDLSFVSRLVCVCLQTDLQSLGFVDLGFRCGLCMQHSKTCHHCFTARVCHISSVAGCGGKPAVLQHWRHQLHRAIMSPALWQVVTNQPSSR
jgi:hypothetical protein